MPPQALIGQNIQKIISQNILRTATCTCTGIGGLWLRSNVHALLLYRLLAGHFKLLNGKSPLVLMSGAKRIPPCSTSTRDFTLPGLG